MNLCQANITYKKEEVASYTRLSSIHKSIVYNIWGETEIKPFQIKYYCVNGNQDFDSNMHKVLLVNKYHLMRFDKDVPLIPWVEDNEIVHALSSDEKLGIQIIAITSENLLLGERYRTISRDYEYKRLGT